MALGARCAIYRPIITFIYRSLERCKLRKRIRVVQTLNVSDAALSLMLLCVLTMWNRRNQKSISLTNVTLNWVMIIGIKEATWPDRGRGCVYTLGWVIGYIPLLYATRYAFISLSIHNDVNFIYIVYYSLLGNIIFRLFFVMTASKHLHRVYNYMYLYCTIFTFAVLCDFYHCRCKRDYVLSFFWFFFHLHICLFGRHKYSKSNCCIFTKCSGAWLAVRKLMSRVN